MTPEGSESGRDLFTNLIPPDGHRGAARLLPISLGAHLLIGGALILIPLFWSSDPTPANGIQTVLLSPPPPPPPPLALGAPEAKPQPVQPKPENESKKATAKPEHAFVAPVETKPIEPETSQPVPDQAGSALGQVNGDSQGMLDGVAGGVVGGVPNGVLGGTLGGTGTGPVTDYDQPPRQVRNATPIMPQEAFVKGIQGTVEVEILIDETGKVTQARVTRSIPALDKAALECVYKYLFIPARKNGRPVATIAEAPVKFSLI
jgi:protein TonB